MFAIARIFIIFIQYPPVRPMHSAQPHRRCQMSIKTSSKLLMNVNSVIKLSDGDGRSVSCLLKLKSHTNWFMEQFSPILQSSAAATCSTITRPPPPERRSPREAEGHEAPCVGRRDQHWDDPWHPDDGDHREQGGLHHCHCPHQPWEQGRTFPLQVTNNALQVLQVTFNDQKYSLPVLRLIASFSLGWVLGRRHMGVRDGLSVCQHDRSPLYGIWIHFADLLRCGAQFM